MLAALLLAAVGYTHPEQLVSTAWVAGHSRDANVRVLDLRRSGFEAGHVPDAVWLDPESIRDPQNAPTYMLSPVAFEQAMSRLGISNQMRTVVYDDRGGLLGARLWWMLNAYGDPNVSLMDGGWVQWTAEKRPVTTATRTIQPGVFKARLQRQWLATADDLRGSDRKTGNTNPGRPDDR